MIPIFKEIVIQLMSVGNSQKMSKRFTSLALKINWFLEKPTTQGRFDTFVGINNKTSNGKFEYIIPIICLEKTTPKVEDQG